MTHVITRSCCNDAACTKVCPTNCIHPTPDDPDFGSAEMLYIDPRNCIDCGACVEVCPVSAIRPDHSLAAAQVPYLALNSEYFAGRDFEQPGFREPARSHPQLEARRIAVVGSGPAAMYAVEEALEHLDEGSEVHVFERLPVPWGLVRHGVAPDHQDTKQVARGFERIANDGRVRFHLNVEVGRDVGHDELLDHFDAVIYGVGAQAVRRLGIPGEDLVGSVSAAELVGWYNGHPDHRSVRFGATSGRAVVVGNGNVALDVARVLATGGGGVESDVSADVIEMLSDLGLSEVVVLGRRGPAHAAFTAPELIALCSLPHVHVVLDEAADLDGATGARRVLLESLPRVTLSSVPPGRDDGCTVVLGFDATPVEITGATQVDGLRLERTGCDVELAPLACSLVVTAIGYEVSVGDVVPVETEAGHIRHRSGRVAPGTYVVGWAKRGPSGVIGTNKSCAAETVATMVDDLRSGRGNRPNRTPDALVDRLECRHDLSAWRRLDRHEVDSGRAVGRPRVKVSDREQMLDLMSR